MRCSESLSRLKGFETNLSFISTLTLGFGRGQTSSESLSRLKGIETQPKTGVLLLKTAFFCSESLSRLKGIETLKRGHSFREWEFRVSSSESLSRLKGIETQLSRSSPVDHFQRLREKFGKPFPFEGN